MTETNIYKFSEYVDKIRWASYYTQIAEISKYIQTRIQDNENGSSISLLYIGKGDNIVISVLKEMFNQNVRFYTFDILQQLKPDYLGDVRKIDEIVNQKFDCVVCCQVLEHIEWKYFEECINKISKICTDKFILSLPQRRAYFSIIIRSEYEKLTFLIPRFYKQWRHSKYERHFDGEHYWEVGFKFQRKKKILEIVNKYFKKHFDFTNTDNPYHWFVVSQKYM